MSLCPEYLVIGHITRDLYNGGHKYGGTSTFSALTAHSMGYCAGIVTSAAKDIDRSHLPAGISLALRPAEASTTFENLYNDGHRSQFIWSHADTLTRGDVPPEWFRSPIVHLGPVAQEVDPALADCFPDALLGLTPQGWMRGWDKSGQVRPQDWRPSEALLKRADAVILSEEDVGGDMDLVQAYAGRTRLLVLTTGWKGATVFQQGKEKNLPGASRRGEGSNWGRRHLCHRPPDRAARDGETLALRPVCQLRCRPFRRTQRAGEHTHGS